MVFLSCRLGITLSLAALLSACDPAARIVASRIFSAPNQVPKHGLEFTPAVQDVAKKVYAQSFDVSVSAATLRVAIVEPGDYSLNWDLRIDGKNVWVEGPIELSAARRPTSPRGVVVMLHGFGCCKEQMLPWALEIASAGYRVALVDLRGHGASTGSWVGFGALEKKDLSRVLDAIDARGVGGLPVGVVGVSYGASVGLGFAAEDPRVRTVVAMEPFSSASVGIRELARAAFPEQSSQISDRTFASAFSIGARRGGFNWAETDTVRSVENFRRPVLFIHGAADTWLSPEHSRRLYNKAPQGSRLVVVPGENHISLPLGVGKIAGDVRTWLDEELIGPSTPAVAANKPAPSNAL